MATTEDRLAVRHLEAARAHLLATGDAEAVKSLDAIIERLDGQKNGAAVQAARKPVPEKPAPAGLVSAHEAAELLGVQYVTAIWAWVREGRLAYEVVDGRSWITRDSVVKLIDDPVVIDEQAFLKKLDESWGSFDPTDEEREEIYPWWPGTEPPGG